jgi:protein-disulfide isomerase
MDEMGAPGEGASDAAGRSPAPGALPGQGGTTPPDGGLPAPAAPVAPGDARAAATPADHGTPEAAPIPAAAGAVPQTTPAAVMTDAGPDAGSDAGAVGLEPVDGDVAVAVGPIAAASSGPSRAARVVGYLAAAVAGGALVLVALAATGSLGSGAQPATSPSPSAAAGEAATTGAAPVLGDPAAPVLVEIWADYQCPYCGLMTHAMEASIIRDYVDTGRIRLAFRDFAFLGQESLDAAVAARCAGLQDGYWRYHDLVFASQQGENQGTFSTDTLVALAGFAGLDRAAFTTCLADPAIGDAVAAETAAGRTLGVVSTPSMNVVGPKGTTLLKGVPGFSGLEDAIEEVMTGVKPSPSPSPSAAPSPDASAAAGSPSPAVSGASPSP